MLHLTDTEFVLVGYLALKTLSNIANALPRPGEPFKVYDVFYKWFQQETANISDVFAGRFSKFNGADKLPTGDK